jgi:hypothetical protein
LVFTAEAASATSDGWGRLTGTLTLNFTVPAGPAQRFLITGSSIVRYVAGSGRQIVSATVQRDGFSYEEPGEGPTVTLDSPGAIATLPFSYVVEFSPGDHSVGIVTYPYNPYQDVTFGKQVLHLTGLGPVP